MKAETHYTVGDFRRQTDIEAQLSHEIGRHLSNEVVEFGVCIPPTPYLPCLMVAHGQDEWKQIAIMLCYFYELPDIVRIAWKQTIVPIPNSLRLSMNLPASINEYTCHIDEATAALATIAREIVIRQTHSAFDESATWFMRRPIKSNTSLRCSFGIDDKPVRYVWTEKADATYNKRHPVKKRDVRT